MAAQTTYLVLGATGRTGRHFTREALENGHRVRVLARDPGKLERTSDDLTVFQGSIADLGDGPDLDELLTGVDVVVSMLGDRRAQRTEKINTTFVRTLVPAMRRHGVRRFLYQAGALSAAPDRPLTPMLWLIRNTVARSHIGQHLDNEAVMRYLADEARDIDWVVHRAGIGSDGPSKGTLVRSASKVGIGTFTDCASYSHRLLADRSAVHTCDFSVYG